MNEIKVLKKAAEDQAAIIKNHEDFIRIMGAAAGESDFLSPFSEPPRQTSL